MEKLIIENRVGNMSMAQALQYALAVVNQGRISNDGTEYCYGTSFDDVANLDADSTIMVVSNKNKTSDRLVIYREKSD